MPNTVIELNEISKSFGANQILKNISLKLERGKFYALLGKNGSGKSTLMRIIMRYEQPDDGSGQILDHLLSEDSADLNLEVGYVTETLNYSLPISIQNLFENTSKLYPKWDQSIFDDFLHKLRIDKSKYVRELSRGQKMQVAFAAAIAIRPSIILLDEITAVLDASARAFFMGYLGKFAREGGTILMATNIVSEVQHFADHMILIDDMQIKFDLPLKEVPERFVKLRKKFGQEQDVFKNPLCVQVSLNSGQFYFLSHRQSRGRKIR